ncbi:MAG: ATP-binding protein [Kiloniellaceae bacterium]
MAAPHAVPVLVVDDDPRVLEDYRYILCPRSNTGAARDRLSASLEDEILGSALSHRGLPRVDLAAFDRAHDAVEAVGRAVEEGRPFALAFIEADVSARPAGLEPAEQIRALDPDVHIILVYTRCGLSPAEVSERVAPADRVFLVRKPFYPAEIQQLVLGLSSRWLAERRRRVAAGAGGFSESAVAHGLSTILERLPAGVLVFDRDARLVSASRRMAAQLPEVADLLVPGTPYHEVQRRLDQDVVVSRAPVSGAAWGDDRLGSGGEVGIDPPWELKLRGSRWLVLAQGAAASGETYCLYFDITALKRRDARRARATHMMRMVQSFAALCEQLGRALGENRAQAQRVGCRHVDSKIAVLPRAAGRCSVEAYVHALAGRLQAVATRQEPSPETLRLDRLVGRIVDQIRADVPAAIEIEVIAGAGLWPVRIDKAGFEVAVRELVRNACEAMPDGGRITLETANARLSPDFGPLGGGLAVHDYVRLSVQDTGPGMPEDPAERAIARPIGAGPADGRLGLGLSLVYGFARQSGGYVEIDGGEGRGGTAVELYFPRAEAAATDTHGARIRADAPSKAATLRARAE